MYRHPDINQYDYVTNPYDFYGAQFIDPEDFEKMPTDSESLYGGENSNLTVNLEDLVAEEGIIFSIL